MRQNVIKTKLWAGECVYGTSLEDCLDPEMAVALAAAGLDFVYVDTEHCTASYSQIQSLCRAAHGAGIVPLVRVTENRCELISRALDVGAMGIIVPRIHSAKAARAAIQAVKFPPEGSRGFGLRSIVTDLRGKNAAEEVASANRETMVVLMIESREGLDHVEEIASLEGLDALFIGPYDLTLSLGLIEQFDSPVFWAAVDRVFAAARMAGIAAGLTSTDISILQEARKRGGRFLLYASDIAVLLAGYKRAIGELKQVEDGATHTA